MLPSPKRRPASAISSSAAGLRARVPRCSVGSALKANQPVQRDRRTYHAEAGADLPVSGAGLGCERQTRCGTGCRRRSLGVGGAATRPPRARRPASSWPRRPRPVPSAPRRARPVPARPPRCRRARRAVGQQKQSFERREDILSPRHRPRRRIVRRAASPSARTSRRRGELDARAGVDVGPSLEGLPDLRRQVGPPLKEDASVATATGAQPAPRVGAGAPVTANSRRSRAATSALASSPSGRSAAGFSESSSLGDRPNPFIKIPSSEKSLDPDAGDGERANPPCSALVPPAGVCSHAVQPDGARLAC